MREADHEAAPGRPLEGLGVGAKGLSITLHVRNRPDLGPSALALAR